MTTAGQKRQAFYLKGAVPGVGELLHVTTYTCQPGMGQAPYATIGHYVVERVERTYTGKTGNGAPKESEVFVYVKEVE